MYLVVVVGVLAGAILRAEGIALSYDGVNWFNGAGGYGNGWGDVGKGVVAPKGGTIYIKYYSQTRQNLSLHYAKHGAEWGSWSATGPALTGAFGDTPDNPVILKLSNVGTDKSTVSWLNGSGTWSALTTTGAYDLAFHGNSIWRLPPITITSEPALGSRWGRLLRWFMPEEPSGSTATVSSVPDGGGTGLLLGVALVSVALFWRVLNRRRVRGRRDSSGERG